MPSADPFADDSNPMSSSPPKYSRYRRRTTDAEPKPPPVEGKAKDEGGVMRSMSRYRRSRTAPKLDPSMDTPTIPELPPGPREPHTQTLGASRRQDIVYNMPGRGGTDPLPTTVAHAREEVVHKRTGETEIERSRRKARKQMEEDERREAEQDAAREAAEEERRREQDRRVAEEEASRRLAEQKKKDLERLEAELDAASPPVQRVSSPRDKLRLFSRKKSTKPTHESSTRDVGEKTGFNTIPRANTNGGEKAIEVEQSRSSQQKHDQQRKSEPPKITKAIVQGGGGIVPQTDAPISASNAGERRVLIRCNQSSINLPITPDTTPVELIHSSANIMTQNISVSTAIVLESYTQLGLERRVRRYERARDILNSWDRDTQHALTIQNSDSPNYDHDLEAEHAAKYTPTDFTVHMYHSQKPGKWNKRYITLLAMGQMFIAKKPGAKLGDKDVVNICHLSDFDIYTPTAQQSRKVLKPPRKHCYAIKSQQKTAMFLSTENFVHFFCSDDRKLAERFYEMVQQWRSWYLVTRLGEGKDRIGKKTSTSGLNRNSSKAVKRASNITVNESPYTIGSFQPLINSDRFGPSPNDNKDDSDDETPLQIPFHLRNGTSPPPKRESKRYPPTVTYKVPGQAEDEFAADGLLGRSYSQRQQQMQMGSNENPFSDGARVPSSNLHHRTPSVRSARRPETSGSGGLQRNSSQRQKPKPLLDFTPTFKEAPQWDKTNKGHGVKGVSGPLVEVATGPESAVPGLPGTLFRREPMAGTSGSRPKTSGSIKERDRDREGAFIKGGLVSNM